MGLLAEDVLFKTKFLGFDLVRLKFVLLSGCFQSGGAFVLSATWGKF